MNITIITMEDSEGHFDHEFEVAVAQGHLSEGTIRKYVESLDLRCESVEETDYGYIVKVNDDRVMYFSHEQTLDVMDPR